HILYLFFFSSRRRHTRFSRDWSSDVCSSDLSQHLPTLLMQQGHLREIFTNLLQNAREATGNHGHIVITTHQNPDDAVIVTVEDRSEERRVGKEGRSRWVTDGNRTTKTLTHIQ